MSTVSRGVGQLIHSYCQVLGTGDDGSSPCLLVSIERLRRYSGGGDEIKILRRYLFNIGEGTQRFCWEAHVKLGKVDKLFITGTGPEEHAGLTELILMLSDLRSPTLEVFGPAGINGLVNGIDCISHRFGRYPEVSATPLPLGEGEFQCSYVLGDEHMEVRCGVVDPTRLRPSDGRGTESSDSDSSESEESSSSSSSGSDDSDGTSDDSDGSSDDSDGSSDDSDGSSDDSGDSSSNGSHGGVEGDSVSVESVEIIELDEHGEQGEPADISKTDVPSQIPAASRDPAVPVGVPSKEPIVFFRCRVLHGDGPVFLVLSCPNISYVAAVKNHAIISGARDDNSVLFVFHLSPEDVVEHAAYAPLLELKGTHVVLGCGRRGRLRGAGGLQHRRIAEKSVQLNFVAPEAFPLHSALWDLQNYLDAHDKGLVEKHVSGRPVTVGRSLLKAVLLPTSARGIDVSAVPPPIDVAEIRQDIEQRVKEEGLMEERDRIVGDLQEYHKNNVETAAIDGNAIAQGPGSAICDATTGSSRNFPNPRPDLTPRYGPAYGSNVSLPPPPPPPPPPPHFQVFGAPVAKRPRTSVKGDLEAPIHIGTSQSRPSRVCQNHAPRPPSSLFSGGGFHGAELFFLGTGSAAPTKHRGCSGIFLRIPQSGLTRDEKAEGEPLRLLMDAGGGTLGHLERQFGVEGAQREIRGLDCVWISHKHADHRTGLFRIIAAHHRARVAERLAAGNRSSEGTNPIAVVAPRAVLDFLEVCKNFSGEEMSFKGVCCRDTMRDDSWRGGSGGKFDGEGGRGGRKGAAMLLEGMRSVPVFHCYDAYGLVLQLWKGGAKLVYSGDTRPCDRLVKAGAGADLLIHEATFDDSMQQDAVSKSHCTTSEAVDVGRRMRAKEIVLTHFSQRYPRVPVLDPERAQHFCVAFDGMVLNRATVSVLPAAARVLSQVLEAKSEEEDDVQEIVLA